MFFFVLYVHSVLFFPLLTNVFIFVDNSCLFCFYFSLNLKVIIDALLFTNFPVVGHWSKIFIAPYFILTGENVSIERAVWEKTIIYRFRHSGEHPVRSVSTIDAEHKYISASCSVVRTAVSSLDYRSTILHDAEISLCSACNKTSLIRPSRLSLCLVLGMSGLRLTAYGMYRSRMWGPDSDLNQFRPSTPNSPKWACPICSAWACHWNSSQTVAEWAKLCIEFLEKSWTDGLWFFNVWHCCQITYIFYKEFVHNSGWGSGGYT